MSTLLPHDMIGVRRVDQIYDTTANKHELLGYTFNNTNSNGVTSFEGKVFLETVSVGPLVVQGQAIEAVSRTVDTYTRNPEFDGFIGLGFVCFTEDE
jgi:Eukaryotic aspartyl protease